MLHKSGKDPVVAAIADADIEIEIIQKVTAF